MTEPLTPSSPSSSPATQPTSAPATQPATQPAAQTRVQNPLTLIMTLKSPEDFEQLNQQLRQIQSLPPDQNPLNQALIATGMVHFARFVFLENNTKMGVITSYDGSLAAYVNAFIDKVGKIFDLLLAHMADAPPLPVEQHRQEFLAYIQAHDVPVIEPFFSAYPTLTVLDILSNSSGS
ncbi:MAG: hypothetical protein ABIS20_19195 [Thermoanaerobaculia bacterium]